MQITDNLLQAIVNYLGTKPYQEVAQLLGAIQKEFSEQKKEVQQEEVSPEKEKEEIKQ